MDCISYTSQVLELIVALMFAFMFYLCLKGVMFLLVDTGVSIIVITCCYGLQESSICCIKRSGDSMRGSVKANAPLNVMICCVNCHNPSLRKMERAFCVWLDDADGLSWHRTKGFTRTHGIVGNQRSFLCPSSLRLPLCHALYSVQSSDNFQPGKLSFCWKTAQSFVSQWFP
jgi:hypothetical protein